MMRIFAKMMRFGVSVAFFCSVAFGDELHIDAKKVYTDEKKGTITAEGEVHITKDKDILDADKVIIYSDSNRKPFKFEAIENVRFDLFTQDNRELKGKCDKLIYWIEKEEYHLIGRVEVQEVGKPNFIKGERVVLNRQNGFANVESAKDEPVRVIIDLNDVQKDKSDDLTDNATKSTDTKDTSSTDKEAQ